jgi:uncharacterized protein (DUF433 family)
VSLPLAHPHVKAAEGQDPVVRGTRVPVRRLWAWYQRGVSFDTLLRRYPMLGPARILDALSFAYDNQGLMAADEQARGEVAS